MRRSYRYIFLKGTPPSFVLPLLGNEEVYRRIGQDDAIEIRAKESRLAKVKLAFLRTIETAWCFRGMAATLQGQLLHLASTRPGRTVRGLPRALTMAACSETSGNLWSRELAYDLEFAIITFEIEHARVYRLTPCSLNWARIWSDASFHFWLRGNPK